jgi:hypothetical protein
MENRGIRKSLVGQRFGKLVVEKYEGTDKFRNSLWFCQCDCGRYEVIKGTLLTTGKVIACKKCGKYSKNPIPIEQTIDKSMIGEKFGKLVIEDIYYKEIRKQNHLVAKCKCECGNTTEVILSRLKSNLTLTCGCLQTKIGKGTLYRLSDDFIGQRFGYLVVDSFDTEKHKWLCKCDCGNTIYCSKSELTICGRKSCGCRGKGGKK